MKLISYLIVFAFLSSCGVPNKQDEKPNIVYAKIDSVALSEIKQTIEPKNNIYAYYLFDDEEIWSDKMFGRCCTEADLRYSELLEFDITANINNDKYPYSNLSDTKYRTAYVFKENQNIELIISLKKTSEFHKYHAQLLVDEVLSETDTLLNPFKLSLVNGYVKSEKTFEENGKIKEMKLYLNNKYKGNIHLKNTPLVQEFTLDFIFSKNDTIKLIPFSYYQGTKYNDICISEIQSSLAHITHPSINKKYKVNELYQTGYEKEQNKKAKN